MALCRARTGLTIKSLDSRNEKWGIMSMKNAAKGVYENQPREKIARLTKN